MDKNLKKSERPLKAINRRRILAAAAALAPAAFAKGVLADGWTELYYAQKLASQPSPKRRPKSDALLDIHLHDMPSKPIFDGPTIIVKPKDNWKAIIQNIKKDGTNVGFAPGDYSQMPGDKYRLRNDVSIRRSIRLFALDPANPPKFFGNKPGASKASKGLFNTISELRDKWLVIEGFYVDTVRNSSGNGGLVRGQGGNVWLEDIKAVNCHTLCLSRTLDNDAKFVAIGCDCTNVGDHSGRAHGVYIDGAHCYIENCTFITNNNAIGHAIKSLAAITTVRNCILGNEESRMSYMVDITSGGGVLVEKNRLINGTHSDNPSVINYSQDKGDHPGDHIYVRNNEAINYYNKHVANFIINRVPTVTPFTENNTLINHGLGFVEVRGS